MRKIFAVPRIELFSLGLVTIMMIVACDSNRFSSSTPVPTVSPDQHLIFFNGTIVTMEEEQPTVQAIAVVGQQIEAVGSDEEILALRRPNSQLIDLDGRTLMPGFVDAHTHILNDADQYLDLSLEEAQQLALENGITTLGNLYTSPGFLKEMRNFDEKGLLRLRTSLYLVATDNCGELQGDWYEEHQPTRNPGEMLRIGGVKIFADGGTCGRPALSYELREGEGLGDLFFTQEELNELVAEVQAAGYQAVIHAIGDRAVEQAQNAIELALAGLPNSHRHRIDHNSVVRPDLLSRYSDIGIVTVIFGTYPVCNPFGPPPPDEYEAWEWPWRALLEANPGLHIAWHGDDPWSGPISPIFELYTMVTRNDIGDDGQLCEPPDWLKNNTLTAAQVLPMMTIESAYALFRDEEVGSLKPGKFADLIVLSGNPLDAEPEAIREIEVWLTLVGGRVEYCAPGQARFCPKAGQP